MHTGRRFGVGQESQAYGGQRDNVDRHNVNTSAADDPNIISFLDAPVGSEFASDPISEQFVPVNLSFGHSLVCLRFTSGGSS